MAKYRKKPVEIEAVQLRWDTWCEVCELIGDFGDDVNRKAEGAWVNPHTGVFTLGQPPGDVSIDDLEIGLEIYTLEGVMQAREGDYIIKGVEGEFYPCKPNIFEKTYEPA